MVQLHTISYDSAAVAIQNNIHENIFFSQKARVAVTNEYFFLYINRNYYIYYKNQRHNIFKVQGDNMTTLHSCIFL